MTTSMTTARTVADDDDVNLTVQKPATPTIRGDDAGCLALPMTTAIAMME